MSVSLGLLVAFLWILVGNGVDLAEALSNTGSPLSSILLLALVGIIVMAFLLVFLVAVRKTG